MALVVKDRVKETTTTTGTGTVTLGGAVFGYQAFSVIGDANTTFYAIVDVSVGAWEVGIGTYTSSGTTLSRTTVLESSNAGSLVSFGAGSKDVFCTYPAERAVYGNATGNIDYTGSISATAGFIPRVVAASGTSGSLTIAGDTTDVYKAEGLTGAITLLTPSGTPVDGQKLIIRLEDNGTGRGITWTTSAGAFRAVGVTLPITTTASKVTYVGCMYNSTDGFWDVVATVTQA
jgi:hypothetical protein